MVMFKDFQSAHKAENQLGSSNRAPENMLWGFLLFFIILSLFVSLTDGHAAGRNSGVSLAVSELRIPSPDKMFSSFPAVMVKPVAIFGCEFVFALRCRALPRHLFETDGCEIFARNTHPNPASTDLRKML